jgi:hypothetical protein
MYCKVNESFSRQVIAGHFFEQKEIKRIFAALTLY